MPVDPRLNCAAEICCGEPPPGATDNPFRSGNCTDAYQARVAILVDLGVPEEIAYKASRKMADMGIVFLSADLAKAIREIAFPV